ncbi:DUF58 domain-containing protein [Alienimonas sp. DA493]|uniref:DUF58 domain-containing protein n=1 Tax=Alienimonas sp. DA493 TaxID=3373605 RepID=UPI0037545ADE
MLALLRLPKVVYDYFQRQWRNELTVCGKALVWCIALSGLGTVSVQMPLYQAFCALVMLLAVASGACSLLRPKVTMDVLLPERATAGSPVVGRATLTNRRRVPAFDVCVGFYDLPEQFAPTPEVVAVPYLPGKGTAEAVFTLRPRRRGRYELPPLRAWSTFPFHIGRGGGRAGHAVGSLLVRPRFERLDRLPLPAGGGRGGGAGDSGQREGHSAEYLGNRDLLPGELGVRLDARAWARTGRPVVRQYREESPAGVAVVFDPRVPADASPERFEAAVSRAAAVCEAVGRNGGDLALFAAGADVHRFRGGTDRAALETALDALAVVEPADPQSDPFAGPELWTGLEQVAAVALIAADDAPRGALVARLGAGGRTALSTPGRLG